MAVREDAKNLSEEPGQEQSGQQTRMTGRRLPTWREMNLDTTPEAEAVLFRLWRAVPAWRKLAMMEDLNRAARQLSLAGLRRRFPEASPAELQRHLADMLLGKELAAYVYVYKDNVAKGKGSED